MQIIIDGYFYFNIDILANSSNDIDSDFREEPFYDIQLNVKGKKDSKCWLVTCCWIVYNEIKFKEIVYVY